MGTDTAEAKPRAQTLAVMVEILRNTCLAQAAQARRFGRSLDEIDWRELAARAELLVSAKEQVRDTLEPKK